MSNFPEFLSIACLGSWVKLNYSSFISEASKNISIYIKQKKPLVKIWLRYLPNLEIVTLHNQDLICEVFENYVGNTGDQGVLMLKMFQ